MPGYPISSTLFGEIGVCFRAAEPVGFAIGVVGAGVAWQLLTVPAQ